MGREGKGRKEKGVGGMEGLKEEELADKGEDRGK